MTSLGSVATNTALLRPTSDPPSLQLPNQNRWMLAGLALGLSNHDVQIRSHARASPSLVQTTQTYHLASRRKQPTGRLLFIRLSFYMANHATASTSTIRCAKINFPSLRAIKPNHVLFICHALVKPCSSLCTTKPCLDSLVTPNKSFISRSNQTSQALA
jgi:hypothetical protein